MKNNYKLTFKQINMIIGLVLVIGFCLASCKVNENSNDNSIDLYVDQQHPFEIKILEAKLRKTFDRYLDDDINQNSDKTEIDIDKEALRLSLITSILNKTNETFNKVQWTITLNESAKPFIASGIIERSSDDFFRVVPQDSKELEHEGLVNGLLNIPGFEDSWNPLITEEEDLKEYHRLNLDDIYENINMVTVIVTWDGGRQEENLPINLTQ